ncbi:hypothetical protein A3762_11575 [Oleiphilus sp. HI0125]|uniref:FAD:protein FMN transferase n=1 Tax=Oleiphilus sp. HI0125 TaxID=1822266 RepID=UPI0007C29853|nr:FAD:protein FMN transferase [Oleiphilus sp. HI0125]KZZ56065.1 hypothetical protein A3762_11575 [Oleiphilus sp. HI0125]
MPDFVLAFLFYGYGNRENEDVLLILRFSALLSFLFIVGCSESPETFKFSGHVMGTTYSVVLVETDLADSLFEETKVGVDEVLSRVDRDLSTYKPDSEIMRFNNADVGQTFMFGPHMQHVTDISIDVLEKSKGYFDPSIGPLVSAWGFGVNSQTSKPSKEIIEQLKSQANMSPVSWDGGRSFKKVGVGFIDYSAVAKGYGVDLVADYLREQGFKDFMVEVGGEIKVAGKNVERINWRMGIEQPDLMMRKAYNIAYITNVSMATSGDYRNYIDDEDGRYSHTINPISGYPVKNDIASVSVILESCAYADAWATALMAMGSEKGVTFASEHNIPAYFILRESKGFSAIATEQMKSYMN